MVLRCSSLLTYKNYGSLPEKGTGSGSFKRIDLQENRPVSGSRKSPEICMSSTGNPAKLLPGCLSSNNIRLIQHAKQKSSDMLQAVRNQLFSSGSQQAVDEAAKQRSDEAVSALATHADGKGVGLKMLSSMGFGAEGLGLGRNAQVFCRASCGHETKYCISFLSRMSVRVI